MGTTQPGRKEFPVFERDLLLENLVPIEPVGTPVIFTSIPFELGQIGSDPPRAALPEPRVIGLCVVAAIAAGRLRRYRAVATDRCARRASDSP